MKTAIFHTVNAGLYLYGQGTGLLIDGIHAGRQEGFSLMPPQIVRQLQRRTGLFTHVDGLLFTHLHGDHFDADGLRTALEAPRPPALYGPGLPGCTAPIREIRPGLRSIRIGRAYVLAMDTVHDGAVYRRDPHTSFLIRLGSESHFIAGDAVLEETQAVELGQFYGAPVDAAFFNLYQLSSPSGLAFLSSLSPKRVFLYHLPMPQDDPYHYRALARQTARRYPAELPPLQILPQMAWLDDVPAPWKRTEKGAQYDVLSGISQHRPLL